MEISKRKLGRTEIEITPIGLGVMQFAGGKGVFRAMFPEITQPSMNEIVKQALDGGINWFDTAELYGSGRSEQGLANALKAAGKTDEDTVIATKWSPFLRTARNIPRTIAKRQQFLEPYNIDLYQVHQPYSFSSPEAEMNAMADLVEAGEIRSVGVSNFNSEHMRRAHTALEKRGLPLASNQVQYSLLERSIETNSILDTAKELGITIIAWSPLASGLLTGKFHKDPSVLQNTPIGRRMRFRRKLEQTAPLITLLEEIAAGHQATAAQVALNWLINYAGETVVAIPGASKASQAANSAGAMKFSLSEEEPGRIDEMTHQYR
jgi:aryl-alcohol dehydrogenase-like predicted oxidoreductase